MNGYEAYQTYQAVRLHFTNESFNYFTYNGKSRTSPETFDLRKDKYLFHRVARMFPDDELPFFFAVNFTKRGKKTWINGMLQDEAQTVYKEWKKWQQARMYNFQNDLDKLSENDFGSLLVCKDGQFPELLNLVFQEEINQDTLLILDQYIHFMDSWDNKITDDFIWKEFHNKMKKYKPFFVHYAPLSDIFYKKAIIEKLKVTK